MPADRAAAMRVFDLGSFGVRWVVAVVLVFATFNPTRFSYYHWISGWTQDDLPLKVLVGLVLLIGFVIYFRAAWRSLGPIGMLLAAALFGALVWVLVYYGLLGVEQRTVMTYLSLLLLATIMAIGLSWSHIRRRLSGQADIDDVDE